MKRFLFLWVGLTAAVLPSMAHTYLQVICEPGVEIRIDDEVVGRSNWKDGGFHTGIPAGEYVVEARKAGYVSQSKTIALRKSDVEVWRLEPFTPLPRTNEVQASTNAGIGALTVYSHPTECTVTLVSASGSTAS